MLMKIEHSASFIKAREYLAACDRLGFRYQVNQFGQVVMKDGGDWSALADLRKRVVMPSKETMKAVLLSLGRMEKPFVESSGIGNVFAPDGTLLIGVAA